MYSCKNDTVLDPFLGTGTTLVSALKNNRNAIGIELTERFFSVAEESINEYLNSINLKLFTNNYNNSYSLIKGDCLDKLNDIPRDTVQLTVTSPPYADLIHKVVEDRNKTHKNSKFVIENNATTNIYSTCKEDLGNMPLDLYIEKVNEIMKQLYRTTKPGGYNAWVVKDYRDTKNKIPYIDLHTKIAMAGVNAGFLYHDLIIWDQNQHRKRVLLGFPSVFYVNQNHSYI